MLRLLYSLAVREDRERKGFWATRGQSLLGQSLLVAALLFVWVGDVSKIESVFDQGRWSVRLLFLLSLSCLWFGCNNAAKEVVKERTIYERERDFNLRAWGYYTSKFVLLALFTALEGVILLGLVLWLCRLDVSFYKAAGVLALLSAAGVAMGLVISAAARTEDMAVTLIPLAIIPQIVLAGVITDLTGVGKVLGELFVTNYWGNRALIALLPEKVARDAGVAQHPIGSSLLAVAGHIVAFVALGLIVLLLQERRERAGTVRGSQVKGTGTARS